ncbi:MAG: zinc finger, matrin-type 2, partial [Marteilia pararefringens]
DVSVAGGGYFCDICDCLVKDSLSYLDHINGKKHQSFLGRTMKIKKTTLPDIRERMATLKKEREDEKSGKNGDGSETFEERVAKQKKMQNERKERQKNRKKELKKNRWD